MDDEKTKIDTDEVQYSIDSIPSSKESKKDPNTKPKKQKSSSGATKKKETADRNSDTENGAAAEENSAQTEKKDNVITEPTLDSLIIDDESVIEENKEESVGGFEEFLSDYKKAIKNTLRAAKSAFGRVDEEKNNSDEIEPCPEEAAVEEQDSDGESAQFSMNIGEEVMPTTEAADDMEVSSDKYDPAKPRIIDNVFDFVELFIFTLAAVLVLTTFFFKHTIVDGESMMNTLHDKEHLIISDVFYTPKRGDIIVFEDRTTILDKPVVKRVIGLPGETVEIKINKDGEYEVYINGEYLEEDYDYNSLERAPVIGGPWVVGEDEVFVLGDNRYNSTDSRHSGVGPIKMDSILGKVLLRIYPFDKFGTVD